MSRDALTDEDVQAILKLLAEAEHVIEFRLRYGDVVIELCKPQQRQDAARRAREPGALDAHSSASGVPAETDIEQRAMATRRRDPPS